MTRPTLQLVLKTILLAGAAAAALADDQPQWGQRHSRNMVSEEKNLPESFDPATGRNVKWSVPLGSETYSTPVVAGGKVLIGTNNNGPYDPRHRGDRGVLLCFDEKDGRLCWHLVVPKLGGDIYLDWPNSGICSSATVEGDKVYVVTNRGEVACLDLDGQADGNDGPYTDEGPHMAPQGSPPMEVRPTDADIVWLFDILGQLGVNQCDAAHCSILLDGQFLYVNTSNGVERSHHRLPAPNAPSLIVLDKATGRLVARDREPIGPRLFHSTWSSPALGEAQGRRLVFFAGGDGLCYAFDALKSLPAAGEIAALQQVWRFDPDPTAPKENIYQYVGNRRVSPSNIKSMPVFHNGRVYLTVGGDIWWGKREAWLKCIDATQSGEVTKTAQLWSYAVKDHCCTTPAVRDGLVFVADCGRTVHCVDAETGKPYWTHQTKGEIWASPQAADGKVYVGTRRGEFLVFAASKEKNLLSSIRLDDPIYSTPIAANGVVYVATMTRLFAVGR